MGFIKTSFCKIKVVKYSNRARASLGYLFHCFPGRCSVMKRDSVKPPACVEDSWAGGSLTRRPKGPFAVAWHRQLSK